MALTARLSSSGPIGDEPEDFFASSLGVIFPDDVTNQHGDERHGLVYNSPHLPKPLQISLADPKKDEDRHLFSHFLWNSSLQLAELIEAGTLGLADDRSDRENGGAKVVVPPISHFDITGHSTLELGAGTALPSLMGALLGARRVLVTDYPAAPVMETLQQNIISNAQPSFSPSGRIVAAAVDPDDAGPSGIQVQGHGWGELDTPLARANKRAFDRIFVADCLWMPWQHENLRASVAWFLAEGSASRAWVVGGFHTGREKMRGFFDAEALIAHGLEVEYIWERDCDGVDREWAFDRGVEDVTVRKRWLAVAVLRRVAEEG
ncbi:hypothetical protein B0T25DRAFT_95838 [Lasiosphaeria hispida]|uniref:Nicotinamide N-methyltransferase n=1 Tax=Lasiosphaeria hispida TaxID=260671 RepID=A0AAJ0MHK2_9PEZI|nr:hypothetical protein B0T25DRAFT_95838 [Lasiosphaeria hispida]